MPFPSAHLTTRTTTSTTRAAATRATPTTCHYCPHVYTHLCRPKSCCYKSSHRSILPAAAAAPRAAHQRLHAHTQKSIFGCGPWHRVRRMTLVTVCVCVCLLLVCASDSQCLRILVSNSRWTRFYDSTPCHQHRHTDTDTNTDTDTVPDTDTGTDMNMDTQTHTHRERERERGADTASAAGNGDADADAAPSTETFEFWVCVCLHIVVVVSHAPTHTLQHTQTKRLWQIWQLTQPLKAALHLDYWSQKFVLYFRSMGDFPKKAKFNQVSMSLSERKAIKIVNSKWCVEHFGKYNQSIFEKIVVFGIKLLAHFR